MKYYVYLGMLFISVGVLGGDFESSIQQAPEEDMQLAQKQIDKFTKEIANAQALVNSLLSELDELWWKRDASSDRSMVDEQIKEKIQQKKKYEIKIGDLEQRIKDPRLYLQRLKRKREKEQERMEKPEYKAKVREKQREAWQERMKDPEYKEKKQKKERERYKEDPEYKEKKQERGRERYKEDPEYKEKKQKRGREAHQERMRDPEYREKRLKRNREAKRECRNKKRQRTGSVETPQTPRAQELVNILTQMGQKQ